jgi:hypothetical protein
VPSVQLLKTVGYKLAIGGGWHASSPPSGFPVWASEYLNT